MNSQKQAINYAHLSGGLETALRSILKHDSLRSLPEEELMELRLEIENDIKTVKRLATEYAELSEVRAAIHGEVESSPKRSRSASALERSKGYSQERLGGDMSLSW